MLKILFIEKPEGKSLFGAEREREIYVYIEEPLEWLTRETCMWGSLGYFLGPNRLAFTFWHHFPGQNLLAFTNWADFRPARRLGVCSRCLVLLG